MTGQHHTTSVRPKRLPGIQQQYLVYDTTHDSAAPLHVRGTRTYHVPRTYHIPGIYVPGTRYISCMNNICWYRLTNTASGPDRKLNLLVLLVGVVLFRSKRETNEHREHAASSSLLDDLTIRFWP